MLHQSREHLRAAGEPYFEHLIFAASVGLMTVGAGLACLIHALVPALCQRTCSTTVALLQQLFADRSQLRTVTDRASGAITFVGLLSLSALTALLPMAVGASGLITALIFALALLFPLAFLLSNSELAPV